MNKKEERILIGHFKWKTTFPKFNDNGYIKVWLRIRNYPNLSLIEVFFTDNYAPLEAIGVIVSNIHTYKFVKRNPYGSTGSYIKYVILDAKSDELTPDKLKEKLSELWSFKAKTKYVYVKFEPKYPLDELVLKTYMEVI